MKQFAEEFEKQFTCLEKNTENPFQLQQKNKLQELIKIFSVILLKNFIKLNVNTDTTTKHVKLAVLNINIATVFLNAQTLKMIHQNTNI